MKYNEWIARERAWQKKIQSFGISNEWLDRQNAWQNTIQSFSISNEWLDRQNAWQNTIQSFSISNEWLDRQNAWQNTIQSFSISNEWLDRQNAWQNTIQSFSISNEWLDRQNAWQNTIQSFSISNEWLDRQNTWQNTIQSAVASNNFSTLYSQLNISDISEINEVIREYSEKDDTRTESTLINEECASKNNTQLKVYTEAELTEFIDSRIEESQRSKSFIKTLIEEVKLNYGVEAVKWLVSRFLIPFLLFIQGFLIENHEIIINIIQESIENGIYVVGYANAKRFVKKSGLSAYENINHIGILRVDSTIRISNSKSSLALASTIKANTVVNIIKRKGNWIKIETRVDDSTITGWIEESKIIKFKRKR